MTSSFLDRAVLNETISGNRQAIFEPSMYATPELVTLTCNLLRGMFAPFVAGVLAFTLVQGCKAPAPDVEVVQSRFLQLLSPCYSPLAKMTSFLST